MSHRKTIGFTVRILGAFALLGAAGLGHAAEQITHYTYSTEKSTSLLSANQPSLLQGANSTRKS